MIFLSLLISLELMVSVSEIAENPKYNPQGRASDGAFADHVGADGTSIWAAATSGNGALAVHLLACLLARAWTGSEAVSIWTEIIEARKAALLARTQEQHFHIGSATASLIEVGRDKFSEWDASARSWLRTADKAMQTSQTQLMLIVDNMDIRMLRKESVYTEIISIWKTAMTLLENLVSGIPQSVKSAEGILGLYAWHLYPDMCVVGQKTIIVKQKDALIKDGGLLTIGLNNAGNEDGNGILWSLPLAHMRHYGKPVLASGAVGSPHSNISFDHLLWIALGSVISAWSNQDSELGKFCEFLVAFGDLVESGSTCFWPNLLSSQAQKYLSSSEPARNKIERYFRLGRRRYASFLADTTQYTAPCFLLSDPNYYFQYVEDEKRIAALREMAASLDAPHVTDTAIIRYLHLTIDGDSITEIASLIPQQIPGFAVRTHRRWIVLNESFDILPEQIIENKKKEAAVIKRSMEIIEHLKEPCGLLDQDTFVGDKFKVAEWSRSQDYSNIQLEEDFHWSELSCPRSLRYLSTTKDEGFFYEDIDGGDPILARDQCIPDIPLSHEELVADHILQGWKAGHEPNTYERSTYRFLFGDPFNAAVFQVVTKDSDHTPTFCLPTEFVINALLSDNNEFSKLKETVRPLVDISCVNEETLDYFKSLIVLGQAHEIYATLEGADISMSLLSKPLAQTNWAQEVLKSRSPLANKEISLACVALFDTAVQPSAGALRHMVGNLGKAGLALLIPPGEVMVREPDLETWDLIDHASFNGKLENNFGSTSLHLTLTGYEQTINVGHRGALDVEAFYADAIVRAYDHGRWVADLDLFRSTEATVLPKAPLRPFNDDVPSHSYVHPKTGAQILPSFSDIMPSTDLFSQFEEILMTPRSKEASKSPELLAEGSYEPSLQDYEVTCNHDQKTKEDTSDFTGLTPIDNWYEYLDQPKLPAIIRARGNWIAHLALSSVPQPVDQPLIIASDSFCWKCVKEVVNQRRAAKKNTKATWASRYDEPFFVLC